MLAVRTVLCPVDFSPATPQQIDFAVDVCRAFGAGLVLHHNITDVSVGAAVGWMWHADHPGAVSSSADQAMRALLTRVPDRIEVAVCMTRGASAEGVWRVSEAAGADLIVITDHDGKASDHAPVIEFLLEHARCPILVLHDRPRGEQTPRFHSRERTGVEAVVVPVNSMTDHPQVDVACDLARLFPALQLHLLHVLAPVSAPSLQGPAIETMRAELTALVPEDLADRTEVLVEDGEAVPVIVAAARHLGASLIVMGEHTRMPVKRSLTHNTARAVLHRAPCPVWYVPAAEPPAMSDVFARFALSDEKSVLWGNV
ncbi:MAG TPA: universal stress protein [Vicinamibacterales bacterium]|nr:universal stress protein [Vicinamibacterales bacterium]